MKRIKAHKTAVAILQRWGAALWNWSHTPFGDGILTAALFMAVLLVLYNVIWALYRAGLWR